MKVAAAVRVGAHDVAFLVNAIRLRPAPKCRRYIDGDKSALTQQKTVQVKAAVVVEPHNVAIRVDRNRIRTARKRSR
jgi:hypothetical protein